MDDRIPTGAYVIRNKQTSLVVHLPVSDVATAHNSKVVAFDQDEHQYRDQQIWWVEALPDYEDDGSAEKEGWLYSITSACNGTAIDVKGERSGGRPLHTFPAHGGLTQRWRLQRVSNDQEG